MKRIAILLIALSVQAHAQFEYVWTLIPRADYEANESDIITAQITLIQKRDWGDITDTNTVLWQYNYTAIKDGMQFALFRYPLCLMGELLADDWDAYTNALPYAYQLRGETGLLGAEATLQFELSEYAWRTNDIPFVQANKQENKKGAGFDVAYAIAEPYYSDKDKSAICVHILKIADTKANRAMVDKQFDRDTYVYSLNTNIPIYVWSTTWDKETEVSRKSCKLAEKAGSVNASCGVLRTIDTKKVMDHYKVKGKK